MLTREEIFRDLSAFADLDSEVVVTQDQLDWLVLMGQGGEPVSLRIASDGGRVIEDRAGESDRHATYLGLLMSSGFGNLRRLVAAQVALITREAPNIAAVETHLPIVGEFVSMTADRLAGRGFFERVEQWLVDSTASENGIRALVVDGPAGIGKTHLIRRLSYSRAVGFGPSGAPPLLHVQARGRKLTTLNDVLSGALDSLRVSLTFEQVPILARYGLLQVAIDGFDELADPYGYENAWGSVLDFIKAISGAAAIVLSGRDTFIDVETVRRALPILTDKNTSAAHIRTLSRGEALEWLAAQGWDQEKQGRLRETGLLEDGSYALRPFFISEIAPLAEVNETFVEFLEFPLRALVDRIISREIKLLAPYIQLSDNSDLRGLIELLFQEVSRFMADGESDSIDVGSLQLLCELVFADHATSETVAVLRHRVAAFALLEQRAGPNERSFPHTEIQDYFLSMNYISLLSRGEISKALSRSIVGTDLLETFHDLISGLSNSRYKTFCTGARKTLASSASVSQEAKNVSCLLLAAGHRFNELSEPIILSGFALDEVALRGVMASCYLKYGSISLLDARSCDLSDVNLDDVNIVTLLADNSTKIPSSMPVPYNLQVLRNGGIVSIYDPDEKEAWFIAHGAKPEHEAAESEAWKLLQRICRVILRQNWIRDVEDDWAGRLLRESEWPAVRAALEKWDLLQVREGVGVGGPKSDFYRVLSAELFLDQANSYEVVEEVKQELAH